jgi:putative SOS response-associated peptidase YedK
VCGRYTLTTPGGRALAERFVLQDADAIEPATLHRFNVCPTEPVAVAIADGDDRVARTMRWGLVPPWAREVGKGFQPINARSETASTKAPFAELFARPERRCLVLADGWYEWLKAERPSHPPGERLPFRYTVDSGGPFAFAGLWGRRRIGAELVHSVCILTTSANAVCAPVHDRMPCVLAGPDEEAAWLAGDSDGLLGPLDAERCAVAPANPAVNTAGVEGEELLTAPPPSEPAQLSLDT